MATSAQEARQEVIEARAALSGQLDELTDAARSAVDIPSKIRRRPLQTAAIAGGAGFLLLGGPKRLLKAAMKKVRPGRTAKYHGLLPDEIERAVKRSAGPRSPEVQAALEEDFASYLQKKRKAEPPPNATQSFWKTYDTLVGPIGAVAVQRLVAKLFRPERAESEETDPGASAAAVVGAVKAGPAAVVTAATSAKSDKPPESR